MGKWRDSKPSQMDSQRALLGEPDESKAQPRLFTYHVYPPHCAAEGEVLISVRFLEAVLMRLPYVV